jgi:hypothetical protein
MAVDQRTRRGSAALTDQSDQAPIVIRRSRPATGGRDANSEANDFVVTDDDVARGIVFGGLHEAFG